MPPAAASASSGSVAWLVPVDSVWLDVDWTSTGISSSSKGRSLSRASLQAFFFWPHEGHKRRNPHRCVWAAGSGLSLASLGWAQLRQQMQSQTAGQAPSIRHHSQSDTLVRNQAHSPAASSRHHDIMLAQQGDQVHGALAATFQSKSSNAALSRASATSEFWTRCEDSLRVVGTRAVPIRASISRIPDFVVPIKVPD